MIASAAASTVMPPTKKSFAFTTMAEVICSSPVIRLLTEEQIEKPYAITMHVNSVISIYYSTICLEGYSVYKYF